MRFKNFRSLLFILIACAVLALGAFQAGTAEGKGSAIQPAAEAILTNEVFSLPPIYNGYGLVAVEKSSDPTRFRCGQWIYDRDGYRLGTVQIGTQCWLAQNLRTRTGQDGIELTTGTDNSERDCISENNTRGTEADCRTRGALYSYYATVKGSDPIQGICPTGWHLPSDTEFSTLEQFLTKGSCNPNRTLRGPGSICSVVEPIDDCFDAGAMLKEGGNTGFNWQLSGMRVLGPGNWVSFIGVGETGYLASRSTGTCGLPGPLFGFVQTRSVSADSNGIVRNGIPMGSWLDDNFMAAPVRCVRN